MPTSPAASTHPGGAPLKRVSSRPCKYGPRDDEGKCPKKPKSTNSTGSKSSARTKPPCKYGPRDANGLCPKKPKSTRASQPPKVKEYKSVDSAAKQAGEVLRSKKATSSQKKEAVRVLGTAVAGEAGKKIVTEASRTVKKKVASKAGREALKSAAKKAAPLGAAALRAAPVVGGIAATLYAGGKALTANRARECKQWAQEQLRATEAKVKLTPEHRRTLLAQYEAHCKKKSVTNSFSGK